MPFGIYHRRFCSLLFRLPNPWWYCAFGFTWCVFSFGLSPPVPLAFFRSGGRTVAISYLLGSFSVYPFYHHRFRLTPCIQAVESWLCCFSLLRLSPIGIHQEICDMVILRFRASIVLYSGFYSELYFWVLFGPVTTGSIGPRLHRAAELW